MNYEIHWTAAAQKVWEQLPEKVAAACIEFVYGGLSDNPQRAGKPRRFELEGLHSARRGDYRVLYSIDDGGRHVTIVAVPAQG